MTKGDAMQLGTQIAGYWIQNEDMHPQTNISGRRWMTADGKYMGVYHHEIPAYVVHGPSPLYWHFPLTEKADGAG